VKLLLMDYTWSVEHDPCAVLLQNSWFISDSTVILVAGPWNIFQVFALNTLRITAPNRRHLHCMDSIVTRLSHLRCFPVPGTDVCQLWKFGDQGPIKSKFSGSERGVIVIQTQLRIDVFLRCFTYEQVCEFVNGTNLRHGLVHCGGIVGTPYFYLRYVFKELPCRHEFCVFDERMYSIGFNEIAPLLGRGDDSSDRDPVRVFLENGQKEGFDVEEDDLMPEDSCWVYHPPLHNPG